MRRLRLAALISGGGRTLLNLADRIDAGEVHATIELVVAHRTDIPGVHRACERGLPVRIIAPEAHDTESSLQDAITARLLELEIDLVCLCGYLRWLRVDPPFAGRVINIHPALLPEFGGKGMYGHHVHRAVLDSGRTQSGCTVHVVDEHYDHGPTILQRTCPVLPSDTVKTLAARVFEQECIAYPQAIELFAQDRVRVEGERVEILPTRDGS